MILRWGFSLTELLVVVAVIVALLALGLPAMQAVRAGAEASRCQSNLRQCAVAHFSYANDNEGELPHTTRQWSGLTQVPWMLALGEYYDRRQSISVSDIDRTTQCPAFRRVAWPVIGFTGSTTYQYWGYVRNNYLYQNGESGLIQQPNFVGGGAQMGDWCQAGWCTPFFLSQITYPSQRFLIGDGYNSEVHLRRGNIGFTYTSAGTGTGHGQIAYQYGYLLTTTMTTNLASSFSATQIRSAMQADAHRGKRSYAMCDDFARNLRDDASDGTNQWWRSIMDPARVTF